MDTDVWMYVLLLLELDVELKHLGLFEIPRTKSKVPWEKTHAC